MAEAPDRQELLTALTTEHSTLQSARSQTASESASRASLYILSVSSAPVALGLIGQASQIGTTFHVFPSARRSPPPASGHRKIDAWSP